MSEGLCSDAAQTLFVFPKPVPVPTRLLVDRDGGASVVRCSPGLRHSDPARGRIPYVQMIDVVFVSQVFDVALEFVRRAMHHI